MCVHGTALTPGLDALSQTVMMDTQLTMMAIASVSNDVFVILLHMHDFITYHCFCSAIHSSHDVALLKLFQSKQSEISSVDHLCIVDTNI